MKPQSPEEPQKPAAPQPPVPAETQPAETQHQHTWEEQTKQVKHEAEGHYETVVIQEAWDEPIYKVTNICNVCQTNLGSSDSAIIHSVETGHSYYVGDFQTGTVHHEVVTEQKWIEDKAAWTETVVVGYKCRSCGETKK